MRSFTLNFIAVLTASLFFIMMAGCTSSDISSTGDDDVTLIDTDNDGTPNILDDDIDGDGIPNDQDDDIDGDEILNVDDDDIDGDGVLNINDNDIDGDGVTNTEDNDIDGDGIPNVDDDDIDGDGIANIDDNDIDGDGIVNSEDNDIDGDGIPNSEDSDIDGDGILNENDIDIDGDGIINSEDDDIDGDGINNDNDDTPDGTGNGSNGTQGNSNNGSDSNEGDTNTGEDKNEGNTDNDADNIPGLVIVAIDTIDFTIEISSKEEGRMSSSVEMLDLDEIRDEVDANNITLESVIISNFSVIADENSVDFIGENSDKRAVINIYYLENSERNKVLETPPETGAAFPPLLIGDLENGLSSFRQIFEAEDFLNFVNIIKYESLSTIDILIEFIPLDELTDTGSFDLKLIIETKGMKKM